MKKCTFYKAMKDKNGKVYAEKTNGYCETFTDSHGNNIEICFEKIINSTYGTYWWNATEKTTGNYIIGEATRKKLIERIKNDFLNRIYDVINSGYYKPVQQMIAKSYAEDESEVEQND